MATDAAPRFSVVVPLLNEAATLDELIRRLVAVMGARHGGFELVLVDDGSSDGSEAILRDREAADPRIRVFQLTRNFGQAAAIACGLFESRGDVMITLDGDLQNPPEEIPKLLDAIDKGADIASARRRQRYEGLWRWLGSRAIHQLARHLLGASIQDVGGQFKAYRRIVVDAVRVAWGPGKPVFPLALWLGFPVVEVVVEHDPRRFGRSRYTLRSLLRINVDLIVSFSTLPLAVLGMLGALCFGAGVAGLLACLLFDANGWLAPAASLTAIGSGATLLAAGVLGQYLARVYRNVAGGSPGWVIRRGPGGGDGRSA
jgi:undecaprenyl-phosphate 4-deoxy-4-formamido-L-arabinose transferase